jgi:APA family basic amino acid/polyamine antiporter
MGSSETTDFSLAACRAPAGAGAAIATAMVGVLWSYGGWQHATYASAEVKNARSTVPLAMTIAAFAVTALYLAANVAYMFVLTPGEIAASPRVAADAMTRVLGPAGGTLISLAIFISTFGVVGIYTLTAPRIYFAMAGDGLFFRRVAEVHPRFQTPALSILAQSAWAALLILFWGTFENLISYVVFTDWIFFGLAGAAVIVFRIRMPTAERTAPVPLYPLTPAFFAAVSAWFVLMTLRERPAQAWAGLAFLALGIPVYYYWKRRRPPAPAAPPSAGD